MPPDSRRNNQPHAGLLLRAIAFAAEKHRDQRRKGIDASPFINHPIEVAAMIANIGGIQDVTVLIAAVLHDTLEDTRTDPNDLEAVFGAEVRSIVEEVTDDKHLPKTRRKDLQVRNARHLSRAAKLIKLADKAANVRDIVVNPPDWPVDRKREYLDWASQVISGCRGTNAPLEDHFDEIFRWAVKRLAAP
ncbi:MAG: HD domain-containing protein [Pelovirga sp.]